MLQTEPVIAAIFSSLTAVLQADFDFTDLYVIIWYTNDIRVILLLCLVRDSVFLECNECL